MMVWASATPSSICRNTTQTAQPRRRIADSYGTPRILQYLLADSRRERCSTSRVSVQPMTCLEKARLSSAAVGDVSTTTPASSPAALMLQRVLSKPTWVHPVGLEMGQRDARPIIRPLGQRFMPPTSLA